MRRQFPPDDSKVENWSVLKNLIPYLAEYKGRVILALGFMLLAKLATTALPFIIKSIVDHHIYIIFGIKMKIIFSKYIHEN